MSKKNNVLIWFRQDLRLSDNAALKAAIETGNNIIPIYIWSLDEEKEASLGAASRWWLHQSLTSLTQDLEQLGSRLIIRQGKALSILCELLAETQANAVFWNRRYEPSIIERDKEIKTYLHSNNIEAKSFNSQLLFEPWTVLNSSEKPFQVFTPFWKACLTRSITIPISSPKHLERPTKWPKSLEIKGLELKPKINWDEGLKKAWKVGEKAAADQLNNALTNVIAGYKENRDRPDLEGVSKLSPYLHFGEISPRQIWYAVKSKIVENSSYQESGEAYLRQLGWREFAYHLLFWFPQTVNKPLKEKFARFPWQTNKESLKAWQQGKTGYPIVDAGMRELWATGWMHNRVRMIVASFLVKDLLISWQDGERWFWDTLVDADLANNVLGWQWTAGCGADAAPYFRIFNPVSQAEKFDPEGNYIKHWVPELKNLSSPWIYKPWEAPANILEQAGVKLGQTYPIRIVDHQSARVKALAALESIK